MFTRPIFLAEYERFARFGAVGIFNTVLGYAVVLAALHLGCGDIASNLLGFAVGLTASFILNGRWTFAARDLYRPQNLSRYAVIVLAAYGVNLAIVIAARSIGIIDNPLTHALAILAYSVVFYFGCARFVFVERPSLEVPASSSSAIALLAARWPELTALVGWFASFLLLREMAVSHDVVWQMWIARQLLGGTALYADILELNPPLWFWMAVPVEAIAQSVGISSRTAIVSANFVFVAAALSILAALIASQTIVVRAVLLLSALVAMIVLPLAEFAQREHIALVAAIPYLVLVAKRAGNEKVAWPLALAAGTIGAAGFALKHYFILVPAFLEIWLLLRAPRTWTPLRPEIGALIAGAATYALVVATFTPEFFTTIIPLISVAYEGYGISVDRLTLNGFVLCWLVSAVVLWRCRQDFSLMTTAAVIAAAAFCISFFAQDKGWQYHAMPATCVAFFAVATLIPPSLPRRDFARWPLLILSLVTPFLLMDSVHPYSNAYKPVADDLLRQERPGDSVFMLTGHPSRIWPMVEEKNLKWPSRHFAFWMVHKIASLQKSHGELSPELRAMADQVRRQTVEDLACNPPHLILVDDFTGSRSPGFDILRFFEESAEFRAFFAQYQKEEKKQIYTPYRRVLDLPMPKPAHCRTIH